MMIRTIKTSVGPYDDGSGYAVDLELQQDTQIWIKQGSGIVLLSRDNWCAMRDAIEKMYSAMDAMARPQR